MAATQVRRAEQNQPASAGGERQVSAGEQGLERTRTRPLYAPRTDIHETADGLVVLADMPGVSPETVEVTLEKRVLTIRGRSEDRPPEGFSIVYREYQPGDYERVFTVSEDIEAERIEASLRNGVLRVVLPKAGPAQAKRIQVQTA